MKELIFWQIKALIGLNEEMRQIFLDTETTGLDPNQGHRIIEIAAVEMNNRQLTENHYHTYLNPERDIDSAAQEVVSYTHLTLPTILLV